MQKHNLDIPIKITPAADLEGKLSTLRTRITEPEFNELCRLAAFLRRGRLTMEDLQHMAERPPRSEEHTSELQSLMRIYYAVFCLKKTNTITTQTKRYRNT